MRRAQKALLTPFSFYVLKHKSRVPQNVKERIIEIRKEYPGWGKVKIQVLLKREKIVIGQSRIQKVINEAKLKRIPGLRKKTRRKNRKHMYSTPKEQLRIPGGLVYMDVKHLNMYGPMVYQFTAIDHATRRLHTKLYTKINSESGMLFLKELESKWDVKYLGTDNGSEFLGKCDKYCKERGIQHVFSTPHSPKQNPYVERVIKTIIDEVYYFTGIETDISKHQAKLDTYTFIYNSIRPHQSLNYMTPNEQYDKLIQAEVLP